MKPWDVKTLDRTTTKDRDHGFFAINSEILSLIFTRFLCSSSTWTSDTNTGSAAILLKIQLGSVHVENIKSPFQRAAAMHWAPTAATFTFTGSHAHEQQAWQTGRKWSENQKRGDWNEYQHLGNKEKEIQEPNRSTLHKLSHDRETENFTTFNFNT